MRETNRLFAFMDGVPVGVFHRIGPESAAFVYEPDYDGVPLSLSLPPGRMADPEVAYAYLDSLLPDSPEVREQLALEAGIPGGVFGMLAHFGEDLQGAVVLSADGDLPAREAPDPQEASLEDAAAALGAREEGAQPQNSRTRPFFVLPGTQEKIVMSQVDGQWYWPRAELPSTHIFKVVHPQQERAAQVEDAILGLAEAVGVPASRSEVAAWLDDGVLQVARWDRQDGRRMHAEDFLQALGDPYLDKYGPQAGDVRKLMADLGLEREHLRQLLFNVAVGNFNAHAKNYSLIHTPEGTELAPLYDVLPSFLWPEHEQDLIVPINGKRRIGDVRRGDWVKWAKETGYDPGLVVAEIEDIFPKVADSLPGALEEAGIAGPELERARNHIDFLNRSYTDA